MSTLSQEHTREIASEEDRPETRSFFRFILGMTLFIGGSLLALEWWLTDELYQMKNSDLRRRSAQETAWDR